MNKTSILSLLFVLSLTLTYQLLQKKKPLLRDYSFSLPCGLMSKTEIEFFKLRQEIQYNKIKARVASMDTRNRYRLITLNFFAIIITLIAYGLTLRKDFLIKDTEIQALKAQINQQKETMDLKDEAIVYMYNKDINN
jgi:hypothetical protein